MIAERTIRFVIAASVALAIMCFQTWWRFDFGTETSTVGALKLDGITPWDGAFVLACATLIGALALVALVRPTTRRLAGSAIIALALSTLIITACDITNTPASNLLPELLPIPRYHATPILYFAAVTSFLIALAGVVLTVARDEHAEQRERGAEAWA